MISKRSISIQKRGQGGVWLAGAGLHLDDDRLGEIGVSLDVVHHRALVVVVGRRGVAGRLLQRARRVLLLVLMRMRVPVRAILKLLLVPVRLHLRGVRRHHRIVAHSEWRRTPLPIFISMPRCKHLPIMPIQNRRVRIRRLRIKRRVTAPGGRQEVVGRQLIRVLVGPRVCGRGETVLGESGQVAADA